MQKAEWPKTAPTGAHDARILHSSFFLLHYLGGLGAAWSWSGGGLTLIAQSSDIERLTTLAIIPRCS
jgi:hypothetical protein